MSDWAFLNKHRQDYVWGGVVMLKADPSSGFNGLFEFNIGTYRLLCISSDGEGWKHVSVSIFGSKKPPPWEVMCKIKDLFWDPEDWVIQFHPARSQYVNNVEGCLHLWQPLDGQLPTPPAHLVGIKQAGVLPKWRR
jgi:hypothetical protein